MTSTEVKEHPVIVFDWGSAVFKAGLCTSALPSCTMPTVAGGAFSRHAMQPLSHILCAQLLVRSAAAQPRYRSVMPAQNQFFFGVAAEKQALDVRMPLYRIVGRDGVERWVCALLVGHPLIRLAVASQDLMYELLRHTYGSELQIPLAENRPGRHAVLLGVPNRWPSAQREKAAQVQAFVFVRVMRAYIPRLPDKAVLPSSASAGLCSCLRLKNVLH